MKKENGILDFGPIEDLSQRIIKVIGVGGGGCNAVRNMYNGGIEGVTYVGCNTDSAQLSKSPIPVKLQLGSSGLGAGGKPEIGRREAESSLDQVNAILDDDTKMVFITTSMGGGTGTGAAPVIAKAAKEKGMLTIGVVTIPFYFEHRKRIVKALKGVDELRGNVDSLLIINNERIYDLYPDPAKMPFNMALKEVDNVLTDAVKGISELVTVYSEGCINLDFRDVETTMRNGGNAIMTMGRARGERRVWHAILNALNTPLLYGSDIDKAKRILISVAASEDCPMMTSEMQDIEDFSSMLTPDIDLIWGTSIDNTLGEDVKIILLATTENDEERVAEDDIIKDDEYYERLISQLYKPYNRNTIAQEDDVVEQEPDDIPISVTPTDSLNDDVEEKPAGIMDTWKNWLTSKLNEVVGSE